MYNESYSAIRCSGACPVFDALPVPIHGVPSPVSPTLLSTKLHVPSTRVAMVPRPELVALLDGALAAGGQLILISAPAGFGKTSLLSVWLQRRPGDRPAPRIGWVSLDHNDDEPSRFWAYLCAALDQVEVGAGQFPLALLASSAAPVGVGSPGPDAWLEPVLTAFINAAAAITGPFALVLDDYHTLSAGAIHSSLAYLLERLPPAMSIVIASRADPPLPLARLRVRGRLVELRAADLRFSPVEVKAFLRDTMGLSLVPQEVAILDARTEGWVAGLQLAALAMRGRQDVAHFIQTFTGSQRYVLNYLLDEVFAGQPAPVQGFLLRTAVLNRLCGDLCDAVVDGSGSREILSRLEQDNLFVVPLDDEGHWYRYHHLFADALRTRLNSMMPALARELYRRASAWHENAAAATGDHALIAEASDYALAAGDPRRAADLVAAFAPFMVGAGELSALMGCLRKLPPSEIEARPDMHVYLAWLQLLGGQIENVEPHLAAAERLLAGAGPDSAGLYPADLPGNMASIRAFLARLQGALQRSIDLSAQALTLAGPDSVFMPAVALNLGAVDLQRGDYASAGRHLAEAYESGPAAHNLYAALAAASELAEIQVLKGQLRQAAEIYENALRIARGQAHAQSLAATAYAYVGLGRLYYEWNDLAQAAQFLCRGIDLSARAGQWTINLAGCAGMAWVRCAEGDEAGLAEMWQRAQEVIARTAAGLDRERSLASLARLAILCGDRDYAERWAEQRGLRGAGDSKTGLHSGKTAPAAGAPAVPGRLTEALIVARLCLAEGWTNPTGQQLQDAVRIANEVAERATATGQIYVLAHALLVKAMARKYQAATEQALATLEQAVALAEGEGFVRLFLDGGGLVKTALQQLAASGRAPAGVARLLTAFGSAAGRATSPPTGPVQAAGATPALSSAPDLALDPLSERELEVLRLIAAGYSNQEIAEKLVLAPSTVKKHINNIYTKMRVGSRTQAVACARSWGLLL
jgi:LuxR family transcriptional regulator, maltose regulon positive regulatory protein